MAADINFNQTTNTWVFTDTISNTSYNVVFATVNKFLQGNIKAELTVESGIINKPFFTNTNLGTYFDTGSSSSNSISITPQVTNSQGFVAEHDSNSPMLGDPVYYTIKTGTLGANTANVVLYTTDGSNAGTNIKEIVGTAVNTEPNTDSYYLAFTGSGNSKVTTEGWFQVGDTATATTKTRYFPIRAAAGTITKNSGSITPSASLSQSNVTFSDNDDSSGISVTATGNGSATFVAQMNVATSGYIPAGNNLWNSGSLSISEANTPATQTKYITGVTVVSGKTFSVANSGTTTITSGISSNTPKGKVNIIAYPSSGTTLTSSQTIVNNGRWVEKTVAAANTWYYGKVKAAGTSITQNNTTVTATGTDSLPTAVERGTATWNSGWLASGSIRAASFANSPTTNVTYIDISNTSEAPILSIKDDNVAGSGYLYINKGYVDNLKISLARLVPDSVDATNGFAPANYILEGYAAFDANGAQIIGTMPKYDGGYQTNVS